MILLIFLLGVIAGQLVQYIGFLPAPTPFIQIPEPEVVVKPVPHSRETVEPIVTAESQADDKAQDRRRREAKRAAKMEYERQQVQLDLEHLETMREGYMALYDTLETELTDSTTTDRRRAQLQRQILVLEEKLYQVDKKRNKAFFIISKAA